MCEIIISISGLRILTAICVRSQQQRQQQTPTQNHVDLYTNLQLASCNWQLATGKLVTLLADLRGIASVRLPAVATQTETETHTERDRQVDTQYGY